MQSFYIYFFSHPRINGSNLVLAEYNINILIVIPVKLEEVQVPSGFCSFFKLRAQKMTLS